MGKRREKSQLEKIADVLTTTELRLRIGVPSPARARSLALKDLVAAREALQTEINELIESMKGSR